MNERNGLSITSRERLRQEIAAQTEQFLRQGGHIDQVRISQLDAVARHIGPVWWDARGNGSLTLGN